MPSRCWRRGTGNACPRSSTRADCGRPRNGCAPAPTSAARRCAHPSAEGPTGDRGLPDADPPVVRRDGGVDEDPSPAAVSADSTTSVSSAFWKTPPVSATTSSPASEATRAASLAAAIPNDSWNQPANDCGVDARSTLAHQRSHERRGIEHPTVVDDQLVARGARLRSRVRASASSSIAACASYVTSRSPSEEHRDCVEEATHARRGHRAALVRRARGPRPAWRGRSPGTAQRDRGPRASPTPRPCATARGSPRRRRASAAARRCATRSKPPKSATITSPPHIVPSVP